MAQANIHANDLSPYLPDIDIRRLPKPGIESGANFLFDVDGPRSSFGHRFVDYNYWTLNSRYKLVELPVGDEFFYGTPKGIFRINSLSRQFEPILVIHIADLHWPWTVAKVGGFYYFAQFNIGLWQYDPLTNTITQIDTPVSGNIIFVIESNGRLIALNQDAVMWSALDDGTDFIPSLLTGAGAQALSMVGGTPFRLDNVDDGFLVATSKGLLKGEITTADFIWRWYVLSNDVRIFSPNGGVVIQDIGVIYLDGSGFHATAGTKPSPWETDFGTYIKDKIITTIDKSKNGTMGIYYSQAARMLFVYFSVNEEEGEMSKTFVFYLPSNKWSSFNYRHFGFMETFDPLTTVVTCSFMGEDGYIRAFHSAPYVELKTEDQHVLSDFVFRPQNEPDCLFNVGITGSHVILGFTDIEYLDVNPLPFAPIQKIQIKNVYDGAVHDYSLPQDGLSSYVTLGVFRFMEQQAADETSRVDGITIALKPGNVNFEYEDLNTEDGTEDLNSESGRLDLGSDVALDNQFKLELMDTNDGKNSDIMGWVKLTLFNDMGAVQQYAPEGMSSIYHKLRVTANNVGHSYALKVIDLSGALTGRLL